MQDWCSYFLGLGFYGFYAHPPASSTDRLPQARLEEIRQRAAACRACGLWRGTQNMVFGGGDPRARLMFIGEGPGEDEDRQGEPFVGRAGQLLTKIIRAMGLDREQVYIANLVKHRPPQNRNPEPSEIVACTPFLEGQIEAIRPAVIVALGRFSAEFLTGNPEGISRIRGRWHDYKGIPVMPTFHPSYLLRQNQAKRQVWEDMKLVLRRLDLPVPTFSGQS
jgi:uracil-DNA glycosylase family 4